MYGEFRGKCRGKCERKYRWKAGSVGGIAGRKCREMYRWMCTEEVPRAKCWTKRRRKCAFIVDVAHGSDWDLSLSLSCDTWLPSHFQLACACVSRRPGQWCTGGCLLWVVDVGWRAGNARSAPLHPVPVRGEASARGQRQGQRVRGGRLRQGVLSPQRAQQTPASETCRCGRGPPRPGRRRCRRGDTASTTLKAVLSSVVGWWMRQSPLVVKGFALFD